MGNSNIASKIIKLLILILVVVIIGGGFVLASNYSSKTETPPSVNVNDNVYTAPRTIIIGPDGIADMVEKVSPAIVNIDSTTKSESPNQSFFNDPFFRQFFGDNILRPQEYVQNSIGTGFIIDPTGLVITNQHVINNATAISVNVSGKKYGAHVVGQDYELDLAILKLEAEEVFPVLSTGDSDQIRAGEWVVAIGNPYGLDHTVTAGVISAKGRPIKIEDRSYKNLIQTDAAINPGNSGGPLLSPSGEVIGINTAVNAEAQGIGFAIPINTVKEVLNDLIDKGKIVRPYLGVYLQDINESMAKSLNIQNQGLIIADIIRGGPAEKAGLKKYDVIIGINDTTTENYDKLQQVLKGYEIGATIKLNIIREGSPMSVNLILAEKP